MIIGKNEFAAITQQKNQKNDSADIQLGPSKLHSHLEMIIHMPAVLKICYCWNLHRFAIFVHFSRIGLFACFLAVQLQVWRRQWTAICLYASLCMEFAPFSWFFCALVEHFPGSNGTEHKTVWLHVVSSTELIN